MKNETGKGQWVSSFGSDIVKHILHGMFTFHIEVNLDQPAYYL